MNNEGRTIIENALKADNVKARISPKLKKGQAEEFVSIKCNDAPDEIFNALSHAGLLAVRGADGQFIRNKVRPSLDIVQGGGVNGWLLFKDVNFD